MAEVVKRPAGGAYGEWLRANRADIESKAKEAGGTKITDVTKKASELWKAMSEADKEPWVRRYEEHKAAFEEYKKSDGYVKPESKKTKQTSPPAKDPDAPKRPVGGAYGIFAGERREEFVKQAAEKGEKGFGAGAKLASEAWKALGEEEKAVYQKKYEAAKAAYDADIASYRTAHPAPAPETPPAKRRRAAATAKASASKSRASPAADAGGQLPEDVLESAEKLGYRAQLINLAGRPEVVEKGCDARLIFEALKTANGLVNKAKAAIMAGA